MTDDGTQLPLIDEGRECSYCRAGESYLLDHKALDRVRPLRKASSTERRPQAEAGSTKADTRELQWADHNAPQTRRARTLPRPAREPRTLYLNVRGLSRPPGSGLGSAIPLS